MHHAVARRIEIQQREVRLDAPRLGNFLSDELHHPVEGDVGQTGLIFRITTANIGVVAGEPYLIELLRLIVTVWPEDGAASPPRDALKITSAFVDRLKMPRIANIF